MSILKTEKVKCIHLAKTVALEKSPILIENTIKDCSETYSEEPLTIIAFSPFLPNKSSRGHSSIRLACTPHKALSLARPQKVQLLNPQ